MKELKEIQFDRENIVLNGNIVRGAILPQNVAEMDRDVTIDGETIVEGAVYGHRIKVSNGDVLVKGAAFAQLELYIESSARGTICFEKALGAVDSVVSHARGCKLMMLSDVNSREVRLTNAFVGGSIFADEVILENCVVVGGVFANRSLSVKSSIMGTFNAPTVDMDGDCALLLPSAFSLEPINCNMATTKLVNLSLADLGAAFKGVEPAANSGKISMNIAADRLRSTLTDDSTQMNVCTYTVIGKVLAADLIDWEKMQNHFLMTAASLGPQLLGTYDLGLDAKGEKAVLTKENLYDFFMNLLKGKVVIPEIDGKFNIEAFATR